MFTRIGHLMEAKLRRAVFWSVAVLAVAVGAGLATVAGLAALADAGMSDALRLFVVSCVWFGIGGIFALIATARPARPSAPPPARAHPGAPGIAEAFTAGFAEGATSASRQRSG